eukprot:CAMPEP_0170246752 /NCGR_PEP_ID=MMETSP0116_2-20130129/23164_1 /TAXON_ID=400756 /ORGANISM="Durinskia baltica, Strain CSIRO CS-38" /LENGTH=172 /DNA_ID=CAMNT_0010497631 /DNA_START=361 /DNA_END=878 /DNA_ORIENTATION=-
MSVLKLVPDVAHDFRGHVGHRAVAAEKKSPVTRSRRRQTEVAQFDHVAIGPSEEKVFGLNIPVHDAGAVQVCESLHHLIDDASEARLRACSKLVSDVEQALFAPLHDHEKLVPFGEGGEELDAVFMLSECSPQPRFSACLVQQLSVDREASGAAVRRHRLDRVWPNRAVLRP